MGCKKTWHLLRHLLDPGSSKSAARKQLARIIHQYPGTDEELLEELITRYINASHTQSSTEQLPQYTGTSNEQLDADISASEETAHDDDLGDMPFTPIICMKGPGLFEADRFTVCVDGVALLTTQRATAFKVMFLLYFVLNIEYPPEVALTLEFVQRAVVRHLMTLTVPEDGVEEVLDFLKNTILDAMSAENTRQSTRSSSGKPPEDEALERRAAAAFRAAAFQEAGLDEPEDAVTPLSVVALMRLVEDELLADAATLYTARNRCDEPESKTGRPVGPRR
ncbi:hypothetical protein MTO96_001841 [Rhipicephalus appendiculatus]